MPDASISKIYMVGIKSKPIPEILVLSLDGQKSNEDTGKIWANLNNPFKKKHILNSQL